MFWKIAVPCVRYVTLRLHSILLFFLQMFTDKQLKISILDY